MKKPTPFGKYYLLERINVGGMAEVFRAKAFGVEGFERLVAVKRILPNIAEDKEFIRMFIDEAKLAVQLNHANIAQIFDLGVVDGSYYIALEHVHGRDLRAIFDRARQLGEAMPVAEACFVVMKVCEGLDYAHNKRDQAGRELNLVHRDVSPQNVLVSFEGEVKIIDFGIAKAAGKGSKTQAGILKGKFGYMSPEQVRGMPVDRRSDVFSCGIVLYELLTGERLFVGESDFSTLEKVRNVEILPPSTYNRKIPDELERIVLKALAKDVDDRYQNAIDLHDELQAFVYTAGEFYSRKDLAGQMKKTFGREIEEETAKLESYRQLKPPPGEVAAQPAVGRQPTGSRPPVNTPPPRKSTQALPATKPPPPPTLGGAPRTTGAMNAMAAAAPPSPPSSQNLQTKPVRKGPGGEELAWDDDELETQIYDDPPEAGIAASGAAADVKRRSTTPERPMNVGGAVEAAAAEPPPPPGPDLSSLVSTGKGWEPPKPASRGSLPPLPGANGTPPHLAAGRVSSPLASATDSEEGLLPSSAAGVPALQMPRETSVSGRLVAPDFPSASYPAAPTATSSPDLFDPMASFGAGVVGRRESNKKNLLFVVLGAAVAVAIAVAVVVVMSNKDKPTEKTANNNPPATDTPKAGDANTGFDLYVNPPGVTQWKLDGEVRTDRLPSRIRGISPGAHNVAIEAPAGFMSSAQNVTVEMGKSSRVDINLEALDITGEFESTPPGATVSLIVDGKRQTLGESPQTAKLDPHLTYSVLFEKQGYVAINKPVAFDGKTKQQFAVTLEKATAVADAGSGAGSGSGSAEQGAVVKPPIDNTPKPPHDTPKPPVDNTPKPPVVHDTPKPPVDNTPKPPVDNTPKPPVDNTPKPPVDNTPKPPVATGDGMLALGSKPPCDVFIDGQAAGHTPGKFGPLKAGTHQVTLVNSEFNIRESFSITIKANDTTRMLKDYSDKLPK